MVSLGVRLLSLVLVLVLVAGVGAVETEEYYYAIEQDGILCGYAHVLFEPTTIDGAPVVILSDSIWLRVSALGKSIEGKYQFEYYIDPATGMYFYHTSHIDQGAMKLGGTMAVDGDSVRIVSLPGNDTTEVALPPGTILQNTRRHKHLIESFVADTLTRKTCQVFSEVDGIINTIEYTSAGLEKLDLADESYYALKVGVLNRTTGIAFTMWLDSTDGLVLKFTSAIRSAYLADAGVVDRIQEADLTSKLIVPVGEMLGNPWALSFMKVRAKLQPAGMWITPEDLNVPGQSFEGTVEDNRIDGVFTISRERYDGSNPPPFPCDFTGVDSLAKYLEPGDLIESDDPAVIAKAVELTTGSKDAWEAATRLSRWVYENISYDLPGGVTAAKTLETRLGECGSHSNLLAGLCRAVGIPARCVFGCMYVPEQGGAFGQHAWNEIYMGAAGWIPVEATADQITYADCGHLRLGEWSSMASMLNAEEMEILEYRVGEGSYAELMGSATEESFAPYIGKYQGPDKVLTVLAQGGYLALDIPGKMVFELKDPDETGNWFFVLTNAASVSFDTDKSGAATSLTILSRQRLPRQSDSAATVDPNLPEEYRPLVGNYTVPMQNAIFAVIPSEGGLALDIAGQKTIPIFYSEARGTWVSSLDPGSKLVVSFEVDDAGAVTALNLDDLTVCPRVPGDGAN